MSGGQGWQTTCNFLFFLCLLHTYETPLILWFLDAEMVVNFVEKMEAERQVCEAALGVSFVNLARVVERTSLAATTSGETT